MRVTSVVDDEIEDFDCEDEITYYLWEAGLGSGNGTMGRMTGVDFLLLVLFTDEIIMAAPLRIADITSGLIGGEDGRVYVYNGKHTTVGDMTGKCKTWMSPCPEEKVVFIQKWERMATC